jgi:bifunctional non-homologous end joining protein LigD
MLADGEMSPLDEYRKKRRFTKTPEPSGGDRPVRETQANAAGFVVQKHRASQLHYDFRLEAEEVLKSWAVPKGPSLDPSVKRLAMAVEDHPIEYAGFEGVIPEGEYGGGTVMVWDQGTYVPEPGTDMATALRGGQLKFTLHGSKLKGEWVLIRTRGRQWLLIKHRDRYASTDDITVSAPRSVVTKRLLAEIAAEGGGDVAKAASADPPTEDRTGGRADDRATQRARPGARARRSRARRSSR